jgi:adenylate kinase
LPSYLGLTGTPGTGKKTLAPMVAARLGIQCHGLNELAAEYGLVRKASGGAEVDPRLLGRRIAASVSGPCLLYGHLLPDAFDRGQFSRVVVLRCEPKTLRFRLARRGYSEAKVSENVEAELIGLVSARAVEAFGSERVAEFDTTTTSPASAACAVADLLRLKGETRPRVDWLPSYDSPEKLNSLLRPSRTASPLT